jgi:hypothetical protein
MQTIKYAALVSTLVSFLLLLSCHQDQKNNTEKSATEKIEEEITTTNVVEQEVALSQYASIINELKGIEKFFVQDNLYNLQGLLKFKNDKRYLALENDLKKKNESPPFINITLLDNHNGYIAFYEDQTECRQVMVFWNKPNKDILISYVQTCCTMFCESDISFLLYSQNDQTYIPIKKEDVINNIAAIISKRPKNYIENEGYNCEFILPRTGKNIRYCLEENCIDLIWQDGIFLATEQQIINLN